jgi:DNA transformation protein
MSVSESYQAFVLESLARVAPGIRARRMFGGVGIYSDDLFFALIDDDALYLKTNAESQREFEALGMKPFRPNADHGEVMGYHQLPESILEDAEALQRWVDTSLAVARQARKRRSPRRGR